MTSEEKLAAIEAKLNLNVIDGDADSDDIRYLLAEVRRLRNRVKEQTAATQEAHEFVDNEIRNHLAGFVELGDKSFPIWQRVRSAVERLTGEYARGREDERKAVVAYLRRKQWYSPPLIIERGEHVAEGKDG